MNLGIVVSKYDKIEAMKYYENALLYRTVYPDCEYNLGNLVRQILITFLKELKCSIF